MKSPGNYVLRTFYVDPELDDDLRTEALDRRISKNDLINYYLRIGMQMVRCRHPGQCADSSTKKRVATTTPTAEATTTGKAKKANTATAPKATSKKREAVKKRSKPGAE
ncbi:MAG: hypothetical protein WCA85_15525 [Paraburkholderia sp.]|uniref:hypothetical protein n=1 Tax=Paraburkholderia sp. TaxID=1926495 RepID=UPI003C67E31D